MCNKAVNNYVHALESVSDCYNAQEMCVKAVYSCPFVLYSAPDQCMTQEICDKAVDHFLSPLKFVPDLFISGKMIKNFHNALFAENGRLFFDEDSGNVTFSSDEISIISVNNIYVNNTLDDVNFDESDPETIIYFRFMAWFNRCKQI